MAFISLCLLAVEWMWSHALHSCPGDWLYLQMLNLHKFFLSYTASVTVRRKGKRLFPQKFNFPSRGFLAPLLFISKYVFEIDMHRNISVVSFSLLVVSVRNNSDVSKSILYPANMLNSLIIPTSFLVEFFSALIIRRYHLQAGIFWLLCWFASL